MAWHGMGWRPAEAAATAAAAAGGARGSPAAATANCHFGAEPLIGRTRRAVQRGPASLSRPDQRAGVGGAWREP